MTGTTEVGTRAATVAAPARTGRRGSRWPARFRSLLTGLAALLLVCVLWELMKAVGPEDGASIGDLRVLPRTDDTSMPHIWQMLERMGQPETTSEGSLLVWQAVVVACWFTFCISIVGWVVGSVVGILLAMAMQRSTIAESALLPWIVLSQTVPLIALAPLVASWGGNITFGSFSWQPWMSVALIASYLAFFPVAVGALRGFSSPSTLHVELMRSYAVGWWKTFLHLRLPSSVSYVVTALKLGAAQAVIGAIVAEISTGTRGGVGRQIIEYAQSGSGDPAKAFAPIIGAAILGLVVAGLVDLLGASLNRYRSTEEAA